MRRPAAEVPRIRRGRAEPWDGNPGRTMLRSQTLSILEGTHRSRRAHDHVQPGTLELPATDPDALTRLERFGGHQAAREMIALFLENAPERLTAAAHGLVAGEDGGDRERAALAEIELGAARRAAALAAQRAGARSIARGGIGDGDHRTLLEQCRDGARPSGSRGWPASASRAGRMTTIAVVEDNADNRLLLQAILGDRYDVVEFDNGVDALAGLAASLPDLVLLDISLPGMDGNEILARIRADDRLRRATGDRADRARDGRRSREVSGGGLQRLHHEADRRRDDPDRGDRAVAGRR